ncbi:hypothetical protein HRG_009547 [Hirsutella rhossiliensis]|uniref:Uncharacterized protein n=1 Tax=Hirsutella rhossiliensis TaxID=111463 RepID=A0A9P8SDY0_9HYPO|nr:uncharacterized protein HRG_09547 [Hirsutella rhossiliensis]KAH0959086.1 hypothetical protein HRG_09547 [Hirsutella rhossiliensis]
MAPIDEALDFLKSSELVNYADTARKFNHNETTTIASPVENGDLDITSGMLSSDDYGGGSDPGCGPPPKPKPKKCKKKGARCNARTPGGNKCCKGLKCISGKCGKQKPPAPPSPPVPGY